MIVRLLRLMNLASYNILGMVAFASYRVYIWHVYMYIKP